jgi:Tfp pilus assembly protein PilX
MIIAWVLSLLTLLASLMMHMERLAALEVVGVNTYVESQKQFIAAEKALLECEQQITNIAALVNPACHIQSTGKNLWLVSSKGQPNFDIY